MKKSILFFVIVPLFVSCCMWGMKKERKASRRHARKHLSQLKAIDDAPYIDTVCTAVKNSGDCVHCVTYAIKKDKHPSCLSWLFRQPRERSRDIRYALWYALRGKKYNTFSLLLDEYPEQINEGISTPIGWGKERLLYTAGGNLDIRAIRILLKYGADPNLGSVVYDSFTPLQQIVSHERATDKEAVKIMKLLLEYGAKVNDNTKGSLFTYVRLASPKRINTLIDAGAWINAKGADGLINKITDFACRFGKDYATQLQKKVMVQGALCTEVADLKNRLRQALVMRRVLKKFQAAGLPKDVISYMLSFFSTQDYEDSSMSIRGWQGCKSTDIWSFSVLAALGNAITPGQCKVAAAYMPVSVLKKVYNQVPKGINNNSIFRIRILEALVERRIEVLYSLLENKWIPYIHYDVKKPILAYSLAGDWPPQKLVADIRKNYEKMFKN